jgi:hypothetical protein
MTHKQEEIATLQLEVLKNIQAELGQLRRDVDGVRGEISGMRTETQTGLSGLRAETRSGFEGLTSQVTELREETHSGFTELREEAHESAIRLRTELVGLRGDMDIGFTALRMLADRRYQDHERRIRDLESPR